MSGCNSCSGPSPSGFQFPAVGWVFLLGTWAMFPLPSTPFFNLDTPTEPNHETSACARKRTRKGGDRPVARGGDWTHLVDPSSMDSAPVVGWWIDLPRRGIGLGPEGGSMGREGPRTLAQWTSLSIPTPDGMGSLDGNHKASIEPCPLGETPENA
eukprot:scaffold1619_cov292-Pavlova_lutheri.AAC.8